VLVLNFSDRSDLVSASTRHIIKVSKDPPGFCKTSDNVKEYLGLSRRQVKRLKMFSLCAYALATF